MRICLAGSFSQFEGLMNKLPELKGNSLYILQSFIDWRNKKPETLKKFEHIYENSDFFLLDSGAYSMIYGGKTVPIKEYVADYIEFINRYNVNHFFELDLYDVIGIDETEKIRALLEKETGKKSIPVFHKTLKLDYYEQLCKEYNYIALGGIAVIGRPEKNISVFRKFTDIAKTYDCRVHGLGYTSLKKLNHTGFYSVDSTSWMAPFRYGGHIDLFKGGEIHQIKKPKGKRLIGMKVINHQFTQWNKLQQYYEKHY